MIKFSVYSNRHVFVMCAGKICIFGLYPGMMISKRKSNNTRPRLSYKVACAQIEDLDRFVHLHSLIRSSQGTLWIARYRKRLQTDSEDYGQSVMYKNNNKKKQHTVFVLLVHLIVYPYEKMPIQIY